MIKSRSKYFGDLLAIILFVTLVLTYAAYSQTHANNSIKNAEEAINRALLYTGFDKVNDVDIKDMLNKAKIDTITDDKTPYLSKSINDRDIWEIEFLGINLTSLFERRTGINESKYFNFKVYIDKESGRLIKIHYIKEGYDPNESPLPSAEVAERQMIRIGEVYHGFPDSLPEYSFIDALDNTAFNPFHAGEIIAQYVIESERYTDPRRVWTIDLRGLDPVPIESRKSAMYTPVYQRNHRRTVIDAKTRHQLFTDTNPQAPQRQSDEKEIWENKDNK